MDLDEAIRFTNEWYPTDPDADEALNVFMDEIVRLRADRERILAAEAESRRSFERARDAQAWLAMQLEGMRAMRDRAAAIARSGSSSEARAVAAVILSAMSE